MEDLYVAFLSMFLLAFGLSALGLGAFTTYFGAGKSRIIGMILTLIGIVVLLIFYFMTIDYFGYDWESEDVFNAFLIVIGIIIGAAVSFGLVIGLMMVIKEPEPEIPGIEDWEKGLSKMEDEKPEEEKKPEEGVEKVDEEPAVEPEGDADKEPEEVQPEEPAPEEEPTDDMSEFLKDKEEKKIVKEDWEKVGEGGEVEEPEGGAGEPPAPEEEGVEESEGETEEPPVGSPVQPEEPKSFAPPDPLVIPESVVLPGIAPEVPPEMPPAPEETPEEDTEEEEGE